MKTIIILTCVLLLALNSFGQYQQKYQTALASKSPEIAKGLPEQWPIFNTKVPLDYVLTEAEVAAGWQLASQEVYDALRDANRQAYKTYVDSQVDDYAIPFRVFVKRLTADEFKLIQAAITASIASADPDFAVLWEASFGGLVGPPDGFNEERKHSRQLRNALRDSLGFSNNRLDKLFAHP